MSRRSTSRRKKVVAAVLVALLVIVAVPLILAFTAPAVYSGLVQRVVRDTTGFELRYSDLQVDLLPLEVTATDLRLRNPSFQEPALTASSVTGVVQVFDYLSGAPLWWAAHGEGLQIRLEENAEGTSIWSPQGSQDAQQAPQQESSTGPSFSRVTLQNVDVLRVGEERHRLQIASLRVAMQEDETLSVNVDGRYQDEPLRVDGTLALPSSERARDVDLEMTGFGGRLNVAGRVGHDGIVPGRASFSADFPDLSGLGALLAADLTVLEPLVLEGTLATPEAGRWQLNTDGNLGQRELALEAVVVTSAPTYDLESMSLQYGDSSMQVAGQADMAVRRLQVSMDARHVAVDQWLMLGQIAGDSDALQNPAGPLSIAVPEPLARWTYQLDVAVEQLEYQGNRANGLSLTVDSGQDGVGIDGSVQSAAGQGNWQLVEPLKVAGQVRVADTGTAVSGIEATVTTAGVDARIDASLPAGGGERLAVNVNGDIRGLGAVRVDQLTSATFDDLLPAHIEASASGDLSGMDLRIQGANVAGTEISGDLKVDPGATPPAVRGTLYSPHVDLNTIPTTRRLIEGSASDKQDEGEQTASNGQAENMISSEALDWSWLRAALIDIKVNVDRLAFNETTFRDVRVLVNLAENQLKVEPIAAQFTRGGVRGHLYVTAQEPGARVDVRMIVNQLVPADLGPSHQGFIDGGATDLAVDLTASGESPKALASTLDGEIALEVQQAIIRNNLFERFTSDVLVQTLRSINPFIEKDSNTDLECAAAHLVAEGGVLTSQNRMVIETSKVVIRAGGTVDLGDESLKLDFIPSPRQGLGISMSGLAQLVRIDGTLTDPDVRVDPAGLLKGGASIGAAIATGGVSLLAQGLFARARNAGTACGSIFEEQVDVPKSIRTSEGDSD